LNVVWWLAALIAGAAPRRIWPRLDPRLPLKSAAFPAGVLTFAIGFAIGVRGFFTFAQRQASANNEWMLRQLASNVDNTAAAFVPYGMSAMALFIFLFTPIGLLSVYLAASGALRGIRAYIDEDDARGDPMWSGVDWAVTRYRARRRGEKARRARERAEGEEVPDALVAAKAVGLPGDVVVIASRRKPEWSKGAIVMTSSGWYRLGDPVVTRIARRLRTLYTLTKMGATEVVRRGIVYELPQPRKKP
jgi:hypothetical protein